MQIDKSQILELLHERGDTGHAEQADRELPQQVDTNQHGDLLSSFGLDMTTLLAKVGQSGQRGDAGHGDQGGLGGLLGR